MTGCCHCGGGGGRRDATRIGDMDARGGFGGGGAYDTWSITFVLVAIGNDVN